MTDFKITKGSANVFADLGFGPQESQNLLLRSQTMVALVQWFNASGLTQAAAAKAPGVKPCKRKMRSAALTASPSSRQLPPAPPP